MLFKEKVVRIRMDKNTEDQLTRIAEGAGLNISETVRLLITQEYFKMYPPSGDDDKEENNNA